jgi:hypothetical protein
MWWRLDRRLRLERARRAQRVTLALQAVVLAATAGAALAVLQIAGPWVAGSGDVLVHAVQRVVLALAGSSPDWATWTTPLALFAAAWLLLVPAALYLAVADE